MPSVDSTAASGAARPAKQPTKIRHSITLSSVGKALADVMNKDSRTTNADKASRKAKEASSRHGRLSAMGTATRASIDVPARKDTSDVKTITRHTRSSSKMMAATSSEEGPSKVADLTTEISLTRHSSLKPKPNSSALPKYRPKSVEPTSKAPTPPLVGDRRKFSPSPDSKPSSSSDSPRPPSPRLKRSAIGHTRAASDIPAHTLKREQPAKITTGSLSGPPPAKSATTAATISAGTSSSRPPSASSNSPSLRTPTTPTRKRVLAGLSGGTPSPSSSLRGSPSSGLQTRNGKSRTNTAGSDTTTTPNTPNQAEGDSYDSLDVEFMLGNAVSPTAPTPALPRTRPPRGETRAMDPITPTRPSNFLPTRSNLSYTSPMPLGDSPPSLRPKPKHPGNDRGSLLSWEQLAAHTSIDDVDVAHMLSEMPAPFRAGAISPSPSLSTIFDIPDSPSTISSSGLSSPANGYQSISRVLLPEVTPSPAVHRTGQFDTSPPTGGDSGMVTLLRLQLASAEHMAKERLEQMQSLEEQLHAAKQARMAEAQELAQQVSDMESQLRCSLQAREKTDDERAAYTVSLENQLRQLVSSRKQDVEATVIKTKAHSAKVYDTAFTTAKKRWEVAVFGQTTSNSWTTVRSMTEGQLELVRSNREGVTTILSGLDHHLQSLRAQIS